MTNDIHFEFINSEFNPDSVIKVDSWIKYKSDKLGRLKRCSALKDSSILSSKDLDLSYQIEGLLEKFKSVHYEFEDYGFHYFFGKKEEREPYVMFEFEENSNHWPAEDLISLCKELYFLTGRCKFGYVYTYGDDDGELYAEETGQFPEGFVSLALNWYTIIHPEYYPDFISKEDLLKTPAYKVEELEYGHIALQIFKEPYDYFSEESMEYIRACTKYLFKVIADMDI